MTEIIIGIDLGTTNSAVAVVEQGRPRILAKGDQKIIPSVVGYSKQNGWIVGQPALNQYTLDPDNTVRSIKRQIGTNNQVTIGGQTLSPQAISAFILRELKTIAEDNLGVPVSKAVITVPAYFTQAQRQATQEAGKIAGLEVVRIINEPTAAALAYGLNRGEDQVAIVYDLGGGTFDVSLVEMVDGVVEVLASHGDTHLGGDDFDQALADYASKSFYKQHQLVLKDNRLANARLNRAAEAAKVHLSNYSEAALREEYLIEQDGVPRHLDMTLTREKFEELVQDLLARTTESLDRVLADADVEADEIDRVLLVGGSTRMPAVWELVADYTGLEPDSEINPDEVVALGAAVQGAIIAGEPIEAILVDVTPYSLGISAATQIGGQVIPDIFSPLIHRNTTIPVTQERVFQTLFPDQDAVEVKVYQGEEPQASANTLLGEFLISGLKPVKLGDHPSVNVHFSFDVNGMLHVSATDQVSGSQQGIQVEANKARLTPDEIAEARKQFGDVDMAERDDILEGAIEPELDEETQALLKRAQTLLGEETLTVEQRVSLTGILNQIPEATTQEELDELAEQLLDMLFDLE